MFRKVANIVGRVLIGAGTVLLLFTAFQLWGTGIFEAHSQAALRARLTRELPSSAARSTAAAAAGRLRSIDAPGPLEVAPPSPGPAEGQPLGLIQIPLIALNQVVVQGTATADLRTGPGHYLGTPLPGEAGNAAIAGHRTTYGHPFYDLNDLGPGDRVVLTTAQGVFVYRVQTVAVVSPDDTAVLAPTTAPVLTLTTCDPRFSASQRLVVRAGLAQSLLFAGHHPAAAAGGSPASPARGGHSRGGDGDRTSASARGSDGVAAGDLAGGSESGAWPATIGSALLVVALAVAVWLLARRARRPWLVYLPGAVVVLGALFLFFAAVSPLLPATL